MNKLNFFLLLFLFADDVRCADSTSVNPLSSNTQTVSLVTTVFSTSPSDIQSDVQSVGYTPGNPAKFLYPSIPSDWTSCTYYQKTYRNDSSKNICYEVKISGNGQWGTYRVRPENTFPLSSYVLTSGSNCVLSNGSADNNKIAYVVIYDGATYYQVNGAAGNPNNTATGCKCETAQTNKHYIYDDWSTTSKPSVSGGQMTDRPYRVVCQKWVSNKNTP
jgi:hypothetical protein